MSFRRTYYGHILSNKRDSSEANNLKAVLYLYVGADVRLTSNLWNEAGLNNGAKGIVVDFVYTDYYGPKNCGVLEAEVVQFRDLAGSTDIEIFLEGNEQSVAISKKQFEWKHDNLALMKGKFLLMMLWDINIHKSQGSTLETAMIDLGNSKKCACMTLVSPPHVKNLKISFFSIFVLSVENCQQGQTITNNLIFFSST